MRIYGQIISSIEDIIGNPEYVLMLSTNKWALYRNIYGQYIRDRSVTNAIFIDKTLNAALSLRDRTVKNRYSLIALSGPQGVKGIKGDQGSQGEPGPIGPSGPSGIQGEPGPIGPSGPSGIQGEPGPIGPQGPSGIQGLQGDIGPQGPSGIQGLQGDIGPQGPSGIQGLQGDIGPQGPSGIQGNIGPQGPSGPSGTQGPSGAQGPAGPVGYSTQIGHFQNNGSTTLNNGFYSPSIVFSNISDLSISISIGAFDSNTGNFYVLSGKPSTAQYTLVYPTSVPGDTINYLSTTPVFFISSP